MPVTVITGASRGIGAFLKSYFEAELHTVVGIGRTAGLDLVCGDVTNPREMARVFQIIHQTYGIDNLINCAGIASMNHFLLTPPETAKRIFDTNVLGTMICSQEAAKFMRIKGGGRIVNLTSVAAPLNLAGEAVYAASKSAVETMSRVMARELGGWGITVNCVGPNPIDTDLIKGVPADKIQKIIDRQAIHRKGTMRDVANAVEFFLRKESDFITGQTLYLGGIC